MSNRHSSTIQAEADSLRNDLVDQLVKDGIIKSKGVERAFRKVPRHIFIRDASLKDAYGDFSIITKKIGITPMTSSTQPSLMASMLEMLCLEKGTKILEIGTGTGYNAAILAEIVQVPKNIFTIDIDPDNVNEARSNLTEAGYTEITVECQDGSKGLPAHSPYDRILATCSVRDIPKQWIKQLKEGGIIVAPIWVNGAQITPALMKEGETLIGLSTTLGGFMEMRSKSYQEMLSSSPTSISELLICSEYPELFNETEVISLLQGSHEEKSLPSEGVTPSKRYSFFVFLALHERKSVELFLESDTDRFGFGDSAAGIVDCESKSACLISRDCKLLVYGHPHAYKKITLLANKWDRLGRPDVDRLRVFAYFQAASPRVKENDIILEKESTRFVIRISES